MLPSTDRYAKTSVPPCGDSVEPHFFVVLEGSRPAAGGLRCSLRDVDEVVLGRADARSVEAGSRRLTLTLPDSTVSARHARLLRQQDAWVVEDAGSTNGTFVNGRQVSRQALDDGDCLGIGQSIMRLRVALPTPQGTPSFTDPAGARDPVLDLATLLPAIAVQDALIARVALSALPVLLLGDTGTGKEVMARAIHAASKRSGAFVALNCGALPDSLVESQLFGHVKGAFSGAARDTIGFVRAAHGGTLFLDEIGDLPYPAQGALLRVLQEGEVVPVGAMRPAAVDVRVIAATHRPIVAMVERGEFRRDLFARLQGFTYKLLPLVERSEDIGLFVADHLRRLAPARASSVLLSPEAALALVRYPWPHNIRELVHVLTHALVLGQEAEVLGLAHLPPAVAAAGRMVSPETSPAVALAPADAALRAELVDHLGRHKGNVTAVARAMRKAPMQIYRWMQRLGVDPDAFR